MKNIVIRSGSLRMGGLERVLIEVLQNIDLEKFKVSLLIEDDSGKENIFIDDIPNGIDLYFIKPEEMILKTKYHRERKGNIYHKLMYNLYMEKERKFVVKRTKEILKEIEERYGDIETFIDYDWGARNYIEKLKVKKSVVWIHNSVKRMLGRESKIKRFGRKIAKYDQIIAICDEMKVELETEYPYLKGKVSRIYNPFNFNRINNLAISEDELNDNEKKLMEDSYILAVSRLNTNQKDYNTLLKGFKELKKEGREEKLYILGDGPSKTQIENWIVEYGLSEEVKLLGVKKNPYIWMKNSKLFVHSSKYEGFGLVLVEALSLGKCVISSNCPVGPVEILGEGKYGEIFEVGNYMELFNKMIDILENSGKRKSFEEKALEGAKRFDVKIVMREYESVF